jgi:hypothetical protein
LLQDGLPSSFPSLSKSDDGQDITLQNSSAPEQTQYYMLIALDCGGADHFSFDWIPVQGVSSSIKQQKIPATI